VMFEPFARRRRSNRQAAVIALDAIPAVVVVMCVQSNQATFRCRSRNCRRPWGFPWHAICRIIENDGKMTVRAPDEKVSAQCSCGAVALTLSGTAIGSFACYCDTCQEGSRRIESLPDAPPVREPDGGTAYVLYRKDRVTYAKGKELLKDFTLVQNPKTNRVVASCCNSAMLMRFDDARHWIPVYRARLGSHAPAIQMRICTRFTPVDVTIPNDVPVHRDYPAVMAMKLLSSRIAMLFRT
jgi:hypothetical protein